MNAPPTTRELTDALGINRTFAWEVRRGKKQLSDEKLARAWRERRWKLGKLRDASDDDADAFARLIEARQ